jgi:hypothetical protein
MAQRVEDDGKSEGPAVMAGIGIECLFWSNTTVVFILFHRCEPVGWSYGRRGSCDQPAPHCPIDRFAQTQTNV